MSIRCEDRAGYSVSHSCIGLDRPMVNPNDPVIGEVRISASKSTLARTTAGGLTGAAPPVLSVIRKWRPRQDSNLHRRE